MEAEDSTLEERPTATRPEARRTIGKLDEEDSVSLMKPSPLQKGRKKQPRAGVGLRAASESQDVSEKGVEARNASRSKVREGRDQHRQRVWDKLDAARKAGDERRTRFERFRPLRDGELPPEDLDEP